MNRMQTLDLLRHHKPRLARRYGVTALALFGFYGPATSKRYFGVQFYLEDLLGRPVDLATEKALRPGLRPYVEREAIRV